MKYLFALFVLFGSFSTAHATSGEELQNSCRIATSDAQRGQTVEERWLSAGQCYGLIEGVMNTLTMWEARNVIDERKPNGEACIPPGVTVRQGALVTLKYLDAHPEKLHILGSTLVMFALTEAYPCKS
jgi:Rap1a immunity proteins